MSRAILALALAGISSLAACGGGSQETVKSPDEGAAPAPAPAPAEPKAEAKPEDKAAPAAGEGGKEAAKGGGAAAGEPFVGDDPGKKVALTGEKAWTIGPGDDWQIGLYDFVRTDGTKNVFKEFGGEKEFSVPGAFTMQAKPVAGLKKGDPVYATIVASGACGRVASASDQEIKVIYLWGGSRSDRTFAPDELLLLDGKLGYGAPVAYKEQADDEWWMPGTLVYKDDKTAWLQGGTKVPANLVKPLDVKRTYKAGDKVWAVPENTWGNLQPATVTKVLNDALQYEIKYDDGSKKVADYCQVTAPLQ